MRLFTRIIFLIIFSFTLFSKENTTIVISFDGFRWDYLNRNLTPKLDSIANEGIRALSLKPVFPSSTFTNHITMMTGLYPENHGIIANYFADLNTFEKFNIYTVSVRESKWYNGEFIWETAKRNGIITASYFWPGSEITLDYRRPNYFEKYEHTRDYKSRIDGVINWLKLPDSLRPKFITLYFDETDSKAHKYGTNSYEIERSLKLLDSLVIYLDSQLKEINIKDNVNLLILSDHGMTDFVEHPEIILGDLIDLKELFVNNLTSYAYIQAPIGKVDSIYNILKLKEKNYKVFRKFEIPDRFHLANHPFVTNIFLLADLGYGIVDKKSEYIHKANHGYDNENIDMHGIFIAKGPDFKSGFKCSTLYNTDIYPLLCKLLNITPKRNIDGKIERIEFILKGE